MKLINEKNIIEEVGVCDFNDIGHWAASYPTIKLGYYDENNKAKYSDIAFSIKNEKGIFGYLICYNVVNIEKNEIIPLYSRKLVLYDFAIDSKAYKKYGIMLIDYLLTYATNNGYKTIEIKKNNKNQFFFDFLHNNYQITEYDNNLYFLIDNPIIDDSKKHLTIYNNDKIKIDDLYFLNSIGCMVLKDIVKLELTDKEKIIIDRSSGIINFPSNVKLLNDNVIINNNTRNIVHMIWKMYENNEVKNIEIDYKRENPNYFEIYEENILYVNKSLQTLYDDVKYVLQMMNKGIEKIYPYEIYYDMNSNSISQSMGGIICDKMIERYTSTCDSNAKNNMEIMNERKQNKIFNEKITNIKRFDFIYNSKDLKKKLTIVFNDVANIFKDNDSTQSTKEKKEDIIKILKRMNFNNWKKEYNNQNSELKKQWIVKLTFEDEVIEYNGTNDYPNVWVYLEWFVKKYYI